MSFVSERPTGHYPLSIATSLAIEGAMGIHPDNPVGKYMLKDFVNFRANLKSLFKNYYDAIGKENVPLCDPQELVAGFHQELVHYSEVVFAEGGFKSPVQFYVCDYLGLEKRFPHAILRVDSTPSQVLYTKTLKLVIGEILKNDPEIAKVYPLKIEEPRISGNTLIHTHLPYDLTTRSYESPFLLESHTGAIKGRNLWYTKYYRGKELAQIPFREDFLIIFGDSYMFSPLGQAYRKNLMELAEKYNWSFATTREKIIYSLDSLKDKFMAEKLKSFLK